MSSPSTKPTEDRCPECGGPLERVVVSRTYEVDGETWLVDGLMPDRCRQCGNEVWPDSELRRGREMLAVKRKAAA